MVVGVRLPEPGVLGIVDAGLHPGRAVQMPDAPGVAHGIARRGGLGVEAMVDDRQAVVAGLVDLTVGKARAEALGMVEAVEIDLWLGMVMGRIGRPLAGIVQHLPQHHVGEGS